MQLTELAREHGGKPAVIMGGSGARLSMERFDAALILSPRSVSFEDELPRLPSGKMLRRSLMDRYRSLPSS